MPVRRFSGRVRAARLVPAVAAVLAATAAANTAPTAAAAPTRSLSVAPRHAVSVTVTVARRQGATLVAGDAVTRLTLIDGRLATNGRRMERTRTEGAARLLVANTGATTTVTLNERELARTRSRSVRLSGAVTVSDRYASGVADPLDRLAQRAGVLHQSRPRSAAYVGQGIDRALHFRGRRDWSAAFLPGLLWQVAAARGSALHARWAWKEVRDLRRVFRFDDPDVGFTAWRAAVRGHDLLCGPGAPPLLTPERCAVLRGAAVDAARQLAARAARTPLWIIPTTLDERRCKQCAPGELRVIVDQLHNLPALTAAAAYAADPALVVLAGRHAHWVAENLVRPDGSVYQQAFVARSTGAVTRVGNSQGHSDTSVWSRGQAWAIHGFALAGTQLRDPELVAVARRTADWWLDHAPPGALPPYDFATPFPIPRVDSSALAIAARGFQRLAAACAALSACDPTRYAAAAQDAEATLVRTLELAPQLGRLGQGTYTAGELTWDEAAELPWGSDFLAEALAE